MTFTAHLRALLLVAIFGAATVAEAAIAGCPRTAESFDATLADAHRIAERRPGLSVLKVEGRSMLPYFGDGSVVIVKTIDFSTLREGMVVAYRNRFGEMVAHRLIRSKAEGWVAQGYNNHQADTTLVTAQNLLGVVYVTLHSNGEINDARAFASLAAKTATVLASAAK
jgi:signal peptidase I